MSLNSLSQNKAPDYSLPLMGQVVFNDDPERRQRVKVRIPSLLEGSNEDLPWVLPICQSMFGMTPSALTVSVPEVGSLAVVQFQEGELYYGLLQGYVHEKAADMPSEFLTNYPNRRGWKDPKGNIFYLDATSGEVKFITPSGVSITIAPSGAVNISASANVTITGSSLTLNGDTQLNGNLTVSGDVLATEVMVTTNPFANLSSHGHNAPSAGGFTGLPIAPY